MRSAWRVAPADRHLRSSLVPAVLRFDRSFVPMSVDKKGDEATSLADSQVPKTPVEPDESLNTENTSLSSGTLHLEDEPDVAAEETAGNSCAAAIEAPADESNGTILEWLTSLTVEEQTAAMGFVDEAFLSAFMAVVPSIQPETSTEATNEGECRSCTFVRILEISCVCWILFELQFKAAEDTTLNFEFEDLELLGWETVERTCTNLASVSPVAGWSLDWDSQVLIKDIELQYTGAINRVSRKVEGTSRLIDDDDSNVAKRVDTMHQRFSSDVFRIRKFSEPSSCGSSLLENVRLVLPSAVQHALGKSVDGLAPFVTVIPEFLEKVGVEEVFNALFSSDIDDEGFLMSSLLVTAEASSPPLWLKLVSKRHPDSETTALSNLVLERFRQQILFSYLEFRASVCARRSETQGKGTNEPSAFAEDSAPPSSWLADVISTALSLSYLAESMEPVRLAECLEPVVSLLPSTKLNAACLIFTPMDCLAFAKGDISISRLDAANAKSLKLISHSLLSDVRSPINEEAIRDETYNSDEGCLLVLNPDGNTTPTSRDVNFASGSKKKKKKTKKRKVRCHSIQQIHEAFSLSHISPFRIEEALWLPLK